MITTFGVTMPPTAPLTNAALAAMQHALDAVGEYATDRILAHAREKLHTSWLDYAHGLQDARSIQRAPGEVTITLVGKMANFLERGAGRFDMKPGLLASPHAKHSKDGKAYMDVPFRHGLPGATTFRPMSQRAATNMAQAVQAVRKARGSINDVRIQTQGRTPGRGGQKVGVYDQMTRIPKDTGGSIGVQYRTFRRVSERSRKEAWMHPGFAGVNAFEAAVNDIAKDIPRIVTDYLKKATR